MLTNENDFIIIIQNINNLNSDGILEHLNYYKVKKIFGPSDTWTEPPP